MQTVILSADLNESVEQAARLLSEGELVAFPTDTLYGVGASCIDDGAVRRLFEVKERSLSKGIPVLLADSSDVEQVAVDIPDPARALMARFWPGPLTIIVPRRAGLPDVLAPGASVAVRVPDHDLARRFIRAAGGAIAASSANLSGQRAALNAAEALSAMGGRVAVILDGGAVHVGQASTIIDCTATPPKIVRRGPISNDVLLGMAVGGP